MRYSWLTATCDALYHHSDMALSPEWLKLPRRRCDDCGKTYKQIRPRREGEHGFCTDNCRKSFHKHKGAYSKLKGDMRKMVEKEFNQLRAELNTLVRVALAQSNPAPPSNR